MSSSFQSTAATRIYDSPVNTFVQPVTAIRKTSIMDVAEILQTVNPAITKFLVSKSDTKAKKDRKRAVADVLDAEINNGAIADLSNKLEKAEGRQTAREIIGGTRAYRRQYEKSLVTLQALKRSNRMESDYDVTRIDTGQKDEDGKPILKFLKEFKTDSNEYKTWRKSYLDEDLDNFKKLNIDSTVVDDFYIPEMSKEMFKNANYGTKQNQAFEYNKFLGLMPEILTEASLHLSKGKEDQAGEILNNYLENMYKGGITGTDATKTYTTLIENIYAQGEKLLDIDVSKPDAAQKLALAESFPDRLLSLVKYGEKDLRSHKDYLTKSAAFDEKFERLVLQKIKYKNQVQPLLNKLEIKNKFQNINKIPLTVDMTDAEKTTAIKTKRNAYEALKNDTRFTTKEEQDYIDQLGKSDNFDLKSKIIPDLKKKITLGVFDGLDTDLEKAISDIENNHATMDNEAIDLIGKLKIFAAESDGLGEDIQTSTTNIMNIVNDNLGVGNKFQILGPFNDQTRSNMVKATKISFDVRDKIKKYYIDYIETNGKRPTSLEVQAIEQQYAVQALAADGRPEFVKLRNQLYPNAENPFKKAVFKQTDLDSDDPNRILNRGSEFTGRFSEENKEDPTNNTNTTKTNNNFYESELDLSSLNTPQNQKIFSDIITSLGGVDGSLLAMAPTTQKSTKEIISKNTNAIQRMETNFKTIYNLAKEVGIKFPEVVAAQFGVESDHGLKITGTNNYLGIKARPEDIKSGNFTEVDTYEEIDGKMVKVKAKFKNFKSVKESLLDYKTHHNDDWFNGFTTRKGTINVDTAEEAIIRLKENGYATDSDYVKLVTDVLNDARRNPALF
jgi:flagellum-specific peptidoglycan hydrolase FlgJ